MPTSCAHPESCTETTNRRSVVALIAFGVEVERSLFAGSTFVPTIAVPCGEHAVPPVPVVDPWIRCQASFIEAVVAMSEFGGNREPGTWTAVMPCRLGE